jgi:hypothetical protein
MGAEAIQSLLPACPEMESLSEPVEFAWPNIELRLQELAYSQWGYFSCRQPQEEVSAYFKQSMRQPTYKMTETNWVKIEEGTLGVYFQSTTKLWVYLWVVPQPAEAQATYVVVALADALAFEPEC